MPGLSSKPIHIISVHQTVHQNLENMVNMVDMVSGAVVHNPSIQLQVTNFIGNGQGKFRALITRRSQVQILSPQPKKFRDSVTYRIPFFIWTFVVLPRRSDVKYSASIAYSNSPRGLPVSTFSEVLLCMPKTTSTCN